MRTYDVNVVPFPFIMFGQTALVEKIDNNNNRNIVRKDADMINRVFWSGSLYTHIDDEYPWLRDRRSIYMQICNLDRNILYNPGHLPYDTFLNEINKSKFTLDLLGVGCPNMRTFEIISTNSLRVAQYSDVVWPFDEQFSEETIFKDATEFVAKINALNQNPELYRKCLENQHNIVNKYFNKKWIKDYILNYI